MRKTQKSKLVDKLHMETIEPEEYIAIVDMGCGYVASEDRERADGSSYLHVERVMPPECFPQS